MYVKELNAYNEYMVYALGILYLRPYKNINFLNNEAL